MILLILHLILIEHLVVLLLILKVGLHLVHWVSPAQVSLMMLDLLLLQP